MNKEDEKFKNKLWLFTTLPNKEVFEICFNLAWERGHSCGYHEVEGYFNDLEEELQKVYDEGFSEGMSVGYSDGYCSGKYDE